MASIVSIIIVINIVIIIRIRFTFLFIFQILQLFKYKRQTPLPHVLFRDGHPVTHRQTSVIIE
jgi:hypothetical protein